jgi:hypothetical protein
MPGFSLKGVKSIKLLELVYRKFLGPYRGIYSTGEEKFIGRVNQGLEVIG